MQKIIHRPGKGHARPHSDLEKIVRTDQRILKAHKDLRQINQARSALAIIRQWAIIGAVCAWAISTGNPFVYVIAVITVATRQHALGALMHEASHRILLKRRWLNDVASDIFCALPLFVLSSRWRSDHLKHHRCLNTDRDPDWRIYQANPDVWLWPKKRKDGLRILLRDLLSLNTFSVLRDGWNWYVWLNHFSSGEFHPPITLRERLVMYVLFGLMAGILWWTNGWIEFLFLWILPLLTVTPVLLRIRSISEHMGLPDCYGTDASRHVDATWFEKISIAPLNANYHVAHHIFPSVPHYNLPRLNEILFKNPKFAARANRTRSYLLPGGVFSELTF